jgi:hypothetical protein
MAATITITRDQLAYVLLNLGLALTGTGRTDEVFAALRAKAAAADAWDRCPPPATPAACSTSPSRPGCTPGTI